MKKCKKCGQDKPLSEFSKDFRLKDNKRTWCKKCTSERSLAYDKNRKKERNNFPFAF